MRKSAYLWSVLAVTLPVPLFAQDSARQGVTADPKPESGDVIVTATRRSERLSDVPLAVSSIGQSALQNSGASDIRQLMQLSPSLLVSSTGTEASASARIRGVGTVGDNAGLESSVATFVDGVYRSRTGVALTELGEIDHIELLRGPQGTLSGRNATAGVINVYTRAPEFRFGGYAEAGYGNYDAVRLAGGLTGPITDTLAYRLDGVAVRRNGYMDDVANRTDYNDRNRYLVRGQLLFRPSSDLSVRVIGDFTHRREKCCGGVYVDLRAKTDPTPGIPGDFAIAPGNVAVDVAQQVAAARGIPSGQLYPSAGDPYNRRIANTPGRAYGDTVQDYGGSAQIDYRLGGVALTSITAYREYRAGSATDTDYNVLDLGYRADDGNSYRQFHTFTQEVRAQGSMFAGRLDWLVGGYYAHETLQIADNPRFGADYGAFAACRVVATIDPSAALRDPNASGCLSATGRARLTGTQSPFGSASGAILAGLDRMGQLNGLGSTRDEFNQRSENFAFFTHDIVHLTSRLSLTAGLRYTHERKDIDAHFVNDNAVCPVQQAALDPLLGNAAVAGIAGTIVSLSCSGNSSAQLNALRLTDSTPSGQFTGAGVLSWKPVDRVLAYASYSRGYKAGGYNLDRTALGSALFPRTAADVATLRFDPETVDAYEFGLKYASRPFTLDVAVFREDFHNFQLNTFNGTVYIVQNVGACTTSLNGADGDASAATGACTSGVGPGVRAQGFELEAGLYPAHNVAVKLGYTLADTRYRRNLVGGQSGKALDPQLFLLPGSQLSNAPRNTATAAFTWTPSIKGGLSGLFYLDGRMTSDYNTGSDLFPEKAQDGYVTVNARIGLSRRDRRWSVELWAQNLTDAQYVQIAFTAPYQGSSTIAQVQRFGAPSFASATQVFGAFLGEPRTYGVTLRSRF